MIQPFGFIIFLSLRQSCRSRSKTVTPYELKTTIAQSSNTPVRKLFNCFLQRVDYWRSELRGDGGIFPKRLCPTDAG